MYAIRSYYESETIIELLEQLCESEKDRITSYNVCYTKLLRYDTFTCIYGLIGLGAREDYNIWISSTTPFGDWQEIYAYIKG